MAARENLDARVIDGSRAAQEFLANGGVRVNGDTSDESEVVLVFIDVMTFLLHIINTKSVGNHCLWFRCSDLLELQDYNGFPVDMVFSLITISNLTVLAVDEADANAWDASLRRRPPVLDFGRVRRRANADDEPLIDLTPTPRLLIELEDAGGQAAFVEAFIAAQKHSIEIWCVHPGQIPGWIRPDMLFSEILPEEWPLYSSSVDAALIDMASDHASRRAHELLGAGVLPIPIAELGDLQPILNAAGYEFIARSNNLNSRLEGWIKDRVDRSKSRAKLCSVAADLKGYSTSSDTIVARISKSISDAGDRRLDTAAEDGRLLLLLVARIFSSDLVWLLLKGDFCSTFSRYMIEARGWSFDIVDRKRAELVVQDGSHLIIPQQVAHERPDVTANFDLDGTDVGFQFAFISDRDPNTSPEDLILFNKILGMNTAYTAASPVAWSGPNEDLEIDYPSIRNESGAPVRVGRDAVVGHIDRYWFTEGRSVTLNPADYSDNMVAIRGYRGPSTLPLVDAVLYLTSGNTRTFDRLDFIHADSDWNIIAREDVDAIMTSDAAAIWVRDTEIDRIEIYTGNPKADSVELETRTA
jgi:hypothetical protein